MILDSFALTLFVTLKRILHRHKAPHPLPSAPPSSTQMLALTPTLPPLLQHIPTTPSLVMTDCDRHLAPCGRAPAQGCHC